jgi:hypothetical protein
MVYSNIAWRKTPRKSSVYAGSWLNMVFDALKGISDASGESLRPQRPAFQIARGAQQLDLVPL